MKKTLLFLLSMVFVCNFALMAQKPFAGSIHFTTKIEGSDDPNVQAQAGTEITKLYFENKTKTEIAQQGATITTISDGTEKSISVVLDIAGLGKYLIESDPKALAERFQTTEFKYDYTEEYLTIAEVKAQKVNVIAVDLETDEETTMVCYVSKELCATDAYNFAEMPGLVGMVLRTENTSPELGENVKIIMEATEVTAKKKVKLVEFLLPSDAVNIKDAPAEIKQMLGFDE